MKKYKYDPIEMASMEKSVIPFGVYQFIDKHVILVITLVAEGDIARLSLVCTQIDAYLRPCVGSIAR